jgi:hypothetical protein
MSIKVNFVSFRCWVKRASWGSGNDLHLGIYDSEACSSNIGELKYIILPSFHNFTQYDIDIHKIILGNRPQGYIS